MGLMLVDKNIFEKIEAPFDQTSSGVSEDVMFQDKASKLGFNSWVDPRIRLGHEKSVILNLKGTETKVNLRAIKQITVNDASQFNFYTCDPTNNGQHTFIGFLSRGNNPDDLPLPCCFKKDQLTSANKKKVALYKKSIGRWKKYEKQMKSQ